MRLSNPARSGTGLRPRGDFDPATSDYQPGDATADGGLTYVCTALPVGTPDARSDDFTRDDQAGWGAASDALSTWTTSMAEGGDAIVANQGTQTYVGPSGWVDIAFQLTPALATADLDLRLKWRATADLGSPQRLGIFGHMAPDHSTWQVLDATFDGTWSHYQNAGPSTDPSLATPWGPGVAGTWYWLRTLWQGSTVRASVWADGTDEPDWQFILDWGVVYAGRTLAVHVGQDTTGDVIEVASFSVTTPPLVPRPSADPAHWALLAAAAPGTPTLIGPMTVDYTDIPLDGNTKSLFTPEPGTVLLRLFPDTDPDHLVQWDVGTLYVGQDVAVTPQNNIAYGAAGSIGTATGAGLDSVGDALHGSAEQAGTNAYATATVFHSSDPVQILYSNPDDDPGPAFGHVELFAVIARPVSP